jgi:hypothetical protein
MRPDTTYILPNGYKFRMQRHPGAPSWRLVGTLGEGTFCHKPCTVSGGGKSEISKSLTDAIIYGSLYIADPEKDFELIDEILNRDYSDRLLPDLAAGIYDRRASRKLLAAERSLGSVIKMLSPSPDFTDEYNAWLTGLPRHILPLVFIIKRFYHEEWGDDWRSHFGVDMVNGHQGHEFKYLDRKLVASYLRVGFDTDDRWRTFKLRQDFIASDKVQMEDDITASVVVPAASLPYNKPAPGGTSVKVAQNCEFRLFQRPDEAIHRGYDKQTEIDLAQRTNFISNFEPLTNAQIHDIVDDTIEFDKFTQPVKDLLNEVVEKDIPWAVSTAHPRIVDGKPTKNPRYLQDRPDVVYARDTYIARTGLRLARRIPADQQLSLTVDATLPGRRNNPAEPKIGVPALAVYNPLHYQELPELLMDFICSVTGKSPSTTGFGSEGAMTKGPFNCLPTTADLNAALISAILTGGGGFTSAAGCTGPEARVDHDVSLLVPEIWSRLGAQERDPQVLIDGGYLEPVADFEHNGKPVLGSRLGYRITDRFVIHYLGRVFDNPGAVFSEAMLKPELQDEATYVEGIGNIVESQRRVAQAYLDDGTVSGAVPPLKALLHIMASGSYEGKDAHDPEIRAMFTREHLLAADWYQERLATKQAREITYWQQAISYLENFLTKESHAAVADRLDIDGRLSHAREQLKSVSAPTYLESLNGTLGADPLSFA